MNKERERASGSFFICSIIIILTLIIVLDSIKTTYDNDLWWLLATGREILQNGFPKTNPWSIHEGMGIVVQQWIPSIILYVTYLLGDLPGLEILLVAQILILFLALWKLCTYLAEGKNAELVLGTILISFISLSTYFSSRPQIYSMIFYTILVMDLEKYRRTNKRKYLFILPIITLLHINCHASMAPLDVFVILLYLLPNASSVFNKKLHPNFEFSESEYSRVPLLFAALISCLTMLINPYGVRGAFYLLESYGAAGYGNYISEMGETHITSFSGFADLALIIGGAIGIGRNGKRIDFPLTILFLSTAFISMTHERNIWLVALFALPLIARIVGNIKLPMIRIKALHHWPVYVIFIAGLLDFMLIYAYSNIWPTMVNYIRLYKADDVDYPLQACDWLAQYAENEGISNNKLKIFNSFNNGGLLEFKGFKVTMDPRPELWEPAITKQETHYYQEYVLFQNGEIDIKEYMSKYDWDFYIVRDNSPLEEYMTNNSQKYQIAKKCNGYKVWEDK